jgi:hypothetical protein
MIKIKCHTCGRDARLIGSGIECNTDRQYEDFQCGKGRVTRLYLDEEGRLGI